MPRTIPSSAPVHVPGAMPGSPGPRWLRRASIAAGASRVQMQLAATEMDRSESWLVLRRLFHAVDDHGLDRSFLRFQLQTELFLQRGKDRWAIRIQMRFIV